MSFRRSVALSVGAVLLVTGCGSSSSSSSSAFQGGFGGGVTGRPVRIALSVPAASQGWSAAIAKAAATEASELGAKVDLRNPGGTDNSDAQIDQIKKLIADKPDVLVVLPINAVAVTPVAQQAMAAGVQVVAIDHELAEANAQRSTIKGDDYAAGYEAGEYFAEQLKCVGNIAEITGVTELQSTAERTQGFADGIAKCNGGIKIVVAQPADNDEVKAQSVMNDILQAHPNAGDINAVYTEDDDMAQGTATSIANAQRNDQVWVSGVGGSKRVMDRIKAGDVIRATFLYNPQMAGAAINAAYLIATNQGFSELSGFNDVPNTVVLHPQKITKENVDQYYTLGY